MPIAPLPPGEEDPAGTIRRLAAIDAERRQKESLNQGISDETISTENEPYPNSNEITPVTGEDPKDPSLAMILGERLIQRNPDLYRKINIPLGSELILSKMTKHNLDSILDLNKRTTVGFYKDYLFLIQTDNINLSSDTLNPEKIATWFENGEYSKDEITHKIISPEGSIVDNTTSIGKMTLDIIPDLYSNIHLVQKVDGMLIEDRNSDIEQRKFEEEKRKIILQDIDEYFPLNTPDKPEPEIQ